MTASHPDVPAFPILVPSAMGARQRLRGPVVQNLPRELGDILVQVSTTVSDDGAIRFGDSLLLLSHLSECLLQSEVTTKLTCVDDSHSQRKAFEAYGLTTGKVMHPCARTTFTLTRADRNGDGYPEDDLSVHYGQPVRLMASALLSDQLLYLHLDASDGKAGMNGYCPVLLPRAARRTLWRIVPLAVAITGGDGTKVGEKRLSTGEVVRVNQNIGLENVDTGLLLMADSHTVNNLFGLECRVYSSSLSTPEFAHKDPFESERFAKWSFVTECWCDAMKGEEESRTQGQKWKSDEGDDFYGESFRDLEREPEADPPELLERSGDTYEADKLKLQQISEHPSYSVCRRIFPLLREGTGGMHSIRKLRKMCASADVSRSGSLPSRVFEGVLVSNGHRLFVDELRKLTELFGTGDGSDYLQYELFFNAMQGHLSNYRLEPIRRAWRQLKARAADGQVHVHEVMETWNYQSHPRVRDGRMDEAEAYQDFLSQWDVVEASGVVSPTEFLRYYRDVSISMEDSNEFVEMLKIAWGL